MPFVRISLKKAVSAEKQRAYADAVHQGLVSSIGIPPDDRFQVIEILGDQLIYDAGYLDIKRDDDMVMVEIHLSFGRPLEKKRALYRQITDNLMAAGMRGENVMIHLIETHSDNWSFGNGMAQYADRAPTHLVPPSL